MNGGGPKCNQFSRNVQLYSFYGAKHIVADHLAKLPVDLSERRVFLQITQGAKVDIRLFERQEGGSYKVTEWSNAKASRLFAEIDDAIIKNKGENCVGDAIKAMLAALGKGETAASLTEPVSAKNAFTPSIQKASEGPDDFIKGTVVILC